MANANVNPKSVGSILTRIVVIMVLALFFAAAGMYIRFKSDAPCSNVISCKDGVPSDVDYCCKIRPLLKVILIATHLLAFALFPFAMHVFWLRAPQLKQLKGVSPFSSILGFAFLMVAIAGEIGWHVGQYWFYQDEYNVLNFVFYFFFMAGIAFWAMGIKMGENSVPLQKTILHTVSHWVEPLLILSPLLVTLVYAGASTLKAHCADRPTHGDLPFDICSINILQTKIPIYLLMTIEFAVLSIRLYLILDHEPLVVFVPVFSVGVNLLFIGLLDRFRASPFWNPVFHTAHDLLGTEMGVLIATLLVWYKTNDPEPTKVE